MIRDLPFIWSWNIEAMSIRRKWLLIDIIDLARKWFCKLDYNYLKKWWEAGCTVHDPPYGIGSRFNDDIYYKYIFTYSLANWLEQCTKGFFIYFLFLYVSFSKGIWCIFHYFLSHRHKKFEEHTSDILCRKLVESRRSDVEATTVSLPSSPVKAVNWVV